MNQIIGFNKDRRSERYAARHILACNPGEPLYDFWSHVFISRVTQNTSVATSADISAVVTSECYRQSMKRYTYVKHGRTIFEFSVLRSMFPIARDKISGYRELPL